MDWRLTALLLAGLTVLIAWMLVQALPLSGSALAHPLRSRLGGAIGSSFAISANPSASMATVAQFAPPAYLAAAAALVGGGRRFGICLLNVVIFSSAALSAYGLAALYFGFDQVFLIDNTAYEGSFTATFVSRNSAATYLAIGLVCTAAMLAERMETGAARPARGDPLALVLAVFDRGGVYLVAGALLLSALLNTGSRAGVAAGLGGLSVVGFLLWRRLPREGRVRVVGPLLIVAGFLVGIAVVSATFLVHRLETVDPRSDERFLLYKDTLHTIAERPLLGHGAGVFADLYPLYQSPELSTSLVWNRAHNSYLQAAAELGLPMFALLVLLAIVCSWKTVKCATSRGEPAPSAVAAIGAFAVVALHSLVDFSIQIQGVGMVFAAVFGAGYGEAGRLISTRRTPPDRDRFSNREEEAQRDPTIARPDAFARKVVLVLLLTGIGVMLFAAGRLALVVSAVPSQFWFSEIYPIAAEVPVDPQTTERAAAAARLVSDPALATARLGPCRRQRAATRAREDQQAFDHATKSCLDVVAAALAANPLSGELWLERAKLLLAPRTLESDFAESLRRSYETSAHVGWLAGNRIVVGLRAYPFLPEDLREPVRQDLDLIMAAPELSGPLVAAFVADESFRSLTLPLIERLSSDKQQAFLNLVKDRVKLESLRLP